MQICCTMVVSMWTPQIVVCENPTEEAVSEKLKPTCLNTNNHATVNVREIVFPLLWCLLQTLPEAVGLYLYALYALCCCNLIRQVHEYSGVQVSDCVLHLLYKHFHHFCIVTFQEGYLSQYQGNSSRRWAVKHVLYYVISTNCHNNRVSEISYKRLVYL